MIFFGIWTAELYLDNFTANCTPQAHACPLANILGSICAALSLWIIVGGEKNNGSGQANGPGRTFVPELCQSFSCP